MAAMAGDVVRFRAQLETRRAIFALDLLFGWTLIGWVVALVWSLTNPILGILR